MVSAACLSFASGVAKAALGSLSGTPAQRG